ncbi:MAG: glycosyltransferase family 4 protein [Steroidobacteraceae bacterium]
MKVLLVHNKYRTSAPSGEDIAVANERRMLESRGVEVIAFERCNDDLDDSSLMAKAAVALNTVWSRRSRAELTMVLREVRPDIAHVHNTFSVISPSVYGACRAAGVPVVQTLHNFRFFCPGALFLRDGKPCEACVEKNLLQSIRYRCYRNSVAATATLATMLSVHRAIGTYDRDIDRYIALTQFARGKFANAGIADAKLVVKPNFIPNPPDPGHGEGRYVVFVGRLTEGKGVETLIDAWRDLGSVKLRIVGDGNLRVQLEARAKREGLNIEFTGKQDRAAVLEAISNATFLIMPSVWYETFGLVVAEAFACGTPVLVSRIGSLDELVQEGTTGAKFTPGDPRDLANAVRTMLGDEARLQRMRIGARSFFDAHLTEEKNYSQLMTIYEDVLAKRVH